MYRFAHPRRTPMPASCCPPPSPRPPIPSFQTEHPRARRHEVVSPGTLGCSRGALTAHSAQLTPTYARPGSTPRRSGPICRPALYYARTAHPPPLGIPTLPPPIVCARPRSAIRRAISPACAVLRRAWSAIACSGARIDAGMLLPLDLCLPWDMYAHEARCPLRIVGASFRQRIWCRPLPARRPLPDSLCILTGYVCSRASLRRPTPGDDQPIIKNRRGAVVRCGVL
ncbi:hypothetical protein HYPSUDRAFT_42979 [Hypholoma sublateritium FD-334 SS-4]|uniref:Uncharacterized protein n=1 Tax=Hypholoma sublateritium (strain FD-334 SS-4) TaxID=945553 RepID=A0A0D2MB97_HYPSF|nr:hypothetical protein HYPSUDRAFT_42979 [Hypholoma sublateritium FD-334 SS-4]